MAHNDYDGDRAKFAFLDAFEKCGIFRVLSDKYEHCFSFTDLGKAVATELLSRISVA